MAVEQVRCNAVLLGAVDTPMLRDGFARRQHPDGADGNRRDLIEKTPLQKIASPQEVAPASAILRRFDPEWIRHWPMFIS